MSCYNLSVAQLKELLVLLNVPGRSYLTRKSDICDYLYQNYPRELAQIVSRIAPSVSPRKVSASPTRMYQIASIPTYEGRDKDELVRYCNQLDTTEVRKLLSSLNVRGRTGLTRKYDMCEFLADNYPDAIRQHMNQPRSPRISLQEKRQIQEQTRMEQEDTLLKEKTRRIESERRLIEEKQQIEDEMRSVEDEIRELSVEEIYTGNNTKEQIRMELEDNLAEEMQLMEKKQQIDEELRLVEKEIRELDLEEEALIEERLNFINNELSRIDTENFKTLYNLSPSEIVNYCSTNKNAKEYCQQENFWYNFIQYKYPNVIFNINDNQTLNTNWRDIVFAVENLENNIDTNRFWFEYLKRKFNLNINYNEVSFQDFRQLAINPPLITSEDFDDVIENEWRIDTDPSKLIIGDKILRGGKLIAPGDSYGQINIELDLGSYITLKDLLKNIYNLYQQPVTLESIINFENPNIQNAIQLGTQIKRIDIMGNLLYFENIIPGDAGFLLLVLNS